METQEINNEKIESGGSSSQSVREGRIQKLSGCYNTNSVYARTTPNMNSERIFHFYADCPRDCYDYIPDRLFYSALRLTPWGEEKEIITHYEKRIAEKDEQKEIVYKMMKALYQEARKKRIFWGVGGAIHSAIIDKLPWNDGDYYVDSKESLHGTAHRNGMVYSPKRLRDENVDKCIVIVTIFRYKEVKTILEELGFVENVNYFNGKNLLSERETYLYNGERDNKWDL